MNKETNKSGPDFHAINNFLAVIMLEAEALKQGLYGELTEEQKKHVQSMLLESRNIQEEIKKR
jgi:hypothetical protein